MSKKKRKNIQVAKPPKEISRNQQERCYLTAKKMLPLFGLEPNLLEVFTKKQKQSLFGIIFEFPTVKAEKENTVPRRFMNKIREEMLQFMKTNYFGNPLHGVTYLDFTIYGYAFYNLLTNLLDENKFAGTPQEETAKLICNTIENSELYTNEGFSDLQNFLVHQTRSYSQVNFRLYGFNISWEQVRTKMTVDGFTTIQMRIQLTVQNCETKMFEYKNIERKAFRLIYTADGDEKARGAVIKREKIYPDAKEDENLNMYIQSHALNRFKQRVDILEPKERNFLIQKVLITEQKVVRFEKNVLLTCTLDGCTPIGYFTFFIRGNDLIVNTFLPVISANMPEGKILSELLTLTNKDFEYFGADKLSFFSTIDFEQIPTLKQALIDADLWKTKLAIDKTSQNNGEIAIDLNKTKIVKQFLEKHEQYRNEMSLSETVS